MEALLAVVKVGGEAASLVPLPPGHVMLGEQRPGVLHYTVRQGALELLVCLRVRLHYRPLYGTLEDYGPLYGVLEGTMGHYMVH